MGFTEDGAQEAIERFGDDLHAGCSWLMTRQTMGHVPKRLKSRAGHTWLGSKVKFNSVLWTVDYFDRKHALIRMCRSDKLPSKWEHISDERLVWISTRHDSTDNIVPQTAWKRPIGEFTIRTAFAEEMETTVDNVVQHFIKYGKPEHTHNSVNTDWEKWRTVQAFMQEHTHKPSRPKPKFKFGTDVHDFRVEWMSYFQALCDVYAVKVDVFGKCLYDESTDSACALFPVDIRSDLALKIEMWKKPVPHMQREYQLWVRDCLPIVIFECSDFGGETCTLKAFVHDMTFVRGAAYDPAIHLHFRRLFFSLYPESRPVYIPGILDGNFFKQVLHSCRKKFKRTLPAAAFVSELYPFQQKCLGWMLDREIVAAPISNWGWSKRSVGNFDAWTSVFGHVSLTPPNNIVRGGLLAQDVGMGKTVEMLALIATNKTKEPTLVVVPTTMLTVWIREAATHTPGLRVVKFHGSRRTRNMDDLRAADIVVTTYRIVVNETQNHVPTLGGVQWGRIILDEAHEMRGQNSETTKAVCRLWSPRRWCVSATPWPKNLYSVIPMLSFFDIAPFNEGASLQNFSCTQSLIRNRTKTLPAFVCDIIREVTFWQEKRHVRMKMPPVVARAVVVPNENKNLYARLLEVVRHRVENDRKCQNAGGRARRMHYARWLRQAATHPSLNRLSDFGMPCEQNHVQSESNLVDTFVESLGDTAYDDSIRESIASLEGGTATCAICRDAVERPTLTPCHHMFCFECIQSAYHHDTARKCPMCRVVLGNGVLKELTCTETGLEVNTSWFTSDLSGNSVEMAREIHEELVRKSEEPGGKIKTFINMVTQKEEKFILFTQYHNAWKKVCRHLERAGIRYVSIEGRMSPLQREKAICAFQNSSEVRVFVMTTKTAGVGITLTAGSQVVFLEPCEDIHVRKQAIGRTWRIGQERTVQITTLQTEGTIDCVTPEEKAQYLDGIL